jgi:serine protease SohB
MSDHIDDIDDGLGDAPDTDDEKFLEPENFGRLPVIGKYLEKRPKVAVVRFAGVIADEARRKPSISHNRYAKLIDRAFDKADTAVALVINSPGGAPAQAELIGAHIRQRALESKLPVIAFVEDVAASGGYWLACAADAIYAQHTSIVGSIGVISASFGFDEFIRKHGVTRRLHTSGRDKSFLDPFLPEKEDDLRRLSVLQKDIHSIFIDWVRERRGSRLRGADKAMFEGEFWTAGIAQDYGLIDGVADMRGFMRDKYGKKVKFVECTPDKRLFALPGIPGISAGDVLGAAQGEALWGRFGL